MLRQGLLLGARQSGRPPALRGLDLLLTIHKVGVVLVEVLKRVRNSSVRDGY